jgi:gliding motility-associated-like protein
VVPIKATVATPLAPNCFGDLTCIRIGEVSGGVPGLYTFQVNQGFNVPIDSCVQVYAGTYLVNVFDQVGCKYDTIITVQQPDPVSVNLGPDIDVNLGDSIDIITPQINANFFITDYLWSTLSPLMCVDSNCTEITGKPIEDMVVKLNIIDENGCSGTDELKITVNKARLVFFPNIIRPNSDDENAYFNVKISPAVAIVNSLKIFDRWGNVLYSKSAFLPDRLNPAEGWDGTFNKNPLVPGVYIYHCQVAFLDGRTLNYTGDVTLVR